MEIIKIHDYEELSVLASELMIGLITGKKISAEQFKHLIGILVIISLAVMIWIEMNKT